MRHGNTEKTKMMLSQLIGKVKPYRTFAKNQWPW